MRARFATRLMALVALVVVLFAGAAPASAHTGFESSTPAQGDVLTDPVGLVTLTFTGDPSALDDGFAALDPSGVVRAPDSVTNPEPGTFALAFDPPLAGGEVGVRWSVRAADGHVIEGGFSFTVTAPATTTTVAATPISTAPISTAPTSTAPTATDAVVGDEGSAATDDAVGATEVAGSSAPPEVAEATVVDDPSAESAAPTAQSGVQATTLDEFLDEAADGDIAGDGRALAGRLLGIPATAVIVGGLAMLAFVFIGARSGVAAGTTIVRGAAVVLAFGALLEFSGSIAASGEEWSTAFTSGPERAMALRFVGAVAVAAGLRAAMRPAAPMRSLSAAVATDLAPVVRPEAASQRVRWDVRPSSPIMLGVALIAASYSFDGHTATRGWAPLHAVVNSVHVVAGSVWFAGVAMLAIAAWRRGPSSSTSVSELFVRFSSLATVVLASVLAAGLAMTVMVLDTPSDLWSTPWGRTLVVKTAVVVVAGALGAYNHIALRPLVRTEPADAVLGRRVRNVVTAEALALVLVLVATAWLVAALA